MYTDFLIRSRPCTLQTLTRPGPDFQPSGKFQLTLCSFKYRPEDCLCRYCLHADNSGRCKIAACMCVAERIKAGGDTD